MKRLLADPADYILVLHIRRAVDKDTALRAGHDLFGWRIDRYSGQNPWC